MNERSKPDFKIFTPVTGRIAMLLTKTRNGREADKRMKEEIKYFFFFFCAENAERPAPPFPPPRPGSGHNDIEINT